MWAHMLSVLVYKLRSKSGVVKMLTTDPDLNNIRIKGSVVAVRQPHIWRIENHATMLPHLGFND